MKRWPGRILLCLILGAITTVAVGWFHAAFFDGMRMAANNPWVQGVSSHSYPRWSVTISQWRGATVIMHRPEDASIAAPPPGLPANATPDQITEWMTRQRAVQQGTGIDTPPNDPILEVPDWSRAASTPHRIAPGLSYIEDARGWPFRAMLSFHDSLAPAAAGLPRTPLGRDWRWDFGGTDWPTGLPRGFPLRPIWPGFLIDTLFYAAIWFGVFFGFTSAKRLIRIKRRRCPRCGYDLRGDLAAGCSECGWGRESPHRSASAEAQEDGMERPGASHESGSTTNQ